MKSYVGGRCIFIAAVSVFMLSISHDVDFPRTIELRIYNSLKPPSKYCELHKEFHQQNLTALGTEFAAN